MYRLNEFEELTTDQNNKRILELADPNIRLIKKLEEKGIEDEELAKMLSELLDGLKEYENIDKKAKKALVYKNAEISSYVRKQYDMTAKGTIQNESMGIFMAIGLALGSGFAAINVAFVGIGLPIGLALGIALGADKEKKAEAEGKVY